MRTKSAVFSRLSALLTHSGILSSANGEVIFERACLVNHGLVVLAVVDCPNTHVQSERLVNDEQSRI